MSVNLSQIATGLGGPGGEQVAGGSRAGRRRSSGDALSILGFLLLVAYLVWYSAPAVPEGIENPRMIRHFDNDEALLIHGWSVIYSKGWTEPGEAALYYYPKLFYNIAGVFLFPYSQTYGVNERLTAIVFRSLNVAFGVGTVIVLFVFLASALQSRVGSLLVCVAFVATPEFMWWLTNSRPIPIELFFVVLSLYQCSKLLEGFTYRRFWWATVFGGLAFSSKLGGIFVLPAIVYASLAGLGSERRSSVWTREVTFLRSFCHVGIVASLVAVMIVCVTLGSGNSIVGGVTELVSEGRWRPRRVRQLDIGVVITSVAVVGAYIAGAIGLRRIGGTSASAATGRTTVLVLSLGVRAAIAYGVIYLLTSPGYLAHPLLLVRDTGVVLLDIVGGRWLGWNVEAMYLSRRLDLIFVLFSRLLLHPSFAVLAAFAGYWAWRRVRQGGDQGAAGVGGERGRWANLKLFTVFVGATLFLMFVVVAQRKSQYLVAVVLFAFAVVIAPVLSMIATRSRAGRIVGYALLTIFVWNCVARAELSLDYRRLKIDKREDTGIAIGRWLGQRYGPETKIVTDYAPFYVPPEFKHVDSIYREDRPLDRLIALMPDVFILIDRRGVINSVTVFHQDESCFLSLYRQVAQFSYRSPYRAPRFQKVEDVRIYEPRGVVDSRSCASAGTDETIGRWNRRSAAGDA